MNLIYIALIVLCGLYLHLWAYLSKLEIELKVMRLQMLDLTKGAIFTLDTVNEFRNELKKVSAEVDQHTNPHNI